MKYYFIHKNIQDVKDLLPNRIVVDLFSEIEKDNSKIYYDKNTNMVVLILDENEEKLLSSKFSITKEDINFKPLYEDIEYFPVIDNNGYERWLGGGVSKIVEGSRWNQGRESIVGGINSPHSMFIGIDKLHEKGLSGKNVKIGCVGGFINPNRTNPSDFYKLNIKKENVYSDNDRRNEDHALQCASVIGNTASDFKAIAPDAELFFASISIEGITWLINQGCDIIYISYIFMDLKQISLLAKQKGSILVIATGNDWNSDKYGEMKSLVINPACSKYSVNINMLDYPYLFSNDKIIDNSSYTNYLPNDNDAKVDFSMLNISICRSLDLVTDETSMFLVGGTSILTAAFAGFLSLMKEKYPNIPMRVLFKYLKIKSKNNRKLVNSGYDIPMFQFED